MKVRTDRSAVEEGKLAREEILSVSGRSEFELQVPAGEDTNGESFLGRFP
jgi:hypothetical protein